MTKFLENLSVSIVQEIHPLRFQMNWDDDCVKFEIYDPSITNHQGEHPAWTRVFERVWFDELMDNPNQELVFSEIMRNIVEMKNNVPKARLQLAGIGSNMTN